MFKPGDIVFHWLDYNAEYPLTVVEVDGIVTVYTWDDGTQRGEALTASLETIKND